MWQGAPLGPPGAGSLGRGQSWDLGPSLCFAQRHISFTTLLPVFFKVQTTCSHYLLEKMKNQKNKGTRKALRTSYTPSHTTKWSCPPPPLPRSWTFNFACLLFVPRRVHPPRGGNEKGRPDRVRAGTWGTRGARTARTEQAGCEMLRPLWGTVWQFLKMLRTHLPRDPAIPEMCTCVPNKSRTGTSRAGP